MLGLHCEALLFDTQSHKIASAALFVTVYALIVGLSLTFAAIACTAGGFIFVIMFCIILNIGAVTLGVRAFLSGSAIGKGDIFVRRFDGSEDRRKKIVSRLLKMRCAYCCHCSLSK